MSPLNDLSLPPQLGIGHRRRQDGSATGDFPTPSVLRPDRRLQSIERIAQNRLKAVLGEKPRPWSGYLVCVATISFAETAPGSDRADHAGPTQGIGAAC